MTRVHVIIYLIFAGPPLLLVLALLADRRALKVSDKARANRQAVGFSPAWFALAPVLVIGPIQLLGQTFYRHSAIPYGVLWTVALVGAWIVYRHRRWPWTAIGIVVAGLIASYFVIALGGVGGMPVH